MFLFVNVLGGLSVVAMAFVIEYLINSIINGEIGFFLKATIIVISYIIIDTIMDYAVEAVNEKLSHAVMHDLREDLTNRIYSENLNEYTDKGSSYYLSKYSNELETIDEDYVKQSLSIYNDVVVFIIAIIASINIEPSFTLIMVLLCSIPLLLPYLSSKRLQQKKDKAVKAQELYFRRLEEIFRNFSVIKLYNSSQRINQIIKKSNRLLKESSLSHMLTNKRIGSWSYGIQSMLNMTTWIVGGYFVVINRVDLAAFFALRQLVNYISFPMQGLSSSYVDLISATKVKNSIINYINSTDKSPDNKLDYIERISLEDVSFSPEGKEILKEVNLEITAGKKYIIVGESGSGKSTLLKVLLGITSPTNGKVIVNDVDLTSLSSEIYFDNIAYIEQKSSVFTGTMKQNVTIFNESFSDEKVKEALIRAGLANWLTKGSGLNETISQYGSKLSGGEERRLDLSRMFLYNKDMIFLDEPTTGLDKENIRIVEDKIKDMHDKTILYVTHNYSEEFLEYFDYRIDVNEGEIEMTELDGVGY